MGLLFSIATKLFCLFLKTDVSLDKLFYVYDTPIIFLEIQSNQPYHESAILNFFIYKKGNDFCSFYTNNKINNFKVNA